MKPLLNLLWIVPVLFGCGDTGETVLVSVTGLPAGVHTLRAYASIDGMNAKSLKDFSGDLTRFAVVLDDGTPGLLALDLEARSDNNCLLARGHGEQRLDGHGSYTLSIPLAPVQPVVCDGEVQVSKSGPGTGTVVSDPPGIQCGATCSFRFDGGRKVRLLSRPDGPSFHAGWSGMCAGTGPCEVTLNGPAQVGVRFEKKARYADNWYWDRPLTMTRNLNGVWGSGTSDVWAVGDQGTILHYDGTLWIPVRSGTTNDLLSVAGRDAKNVWAVGRKGTTLRWNGIAWSILDGKTTLDLNSVAISSYQTDPNTPIAVTPQGVYLWTADGWTMYPTSPTMPFNFVLGYPASEDAVGPGGAYYHDAYAGSPKWASSGGGFNSKNLLGIALAALDQLGRGTYWLVGEGGAFFRYEQVGNKTTDLSTGTANLRGVWSTPPMRSQPAGPAWIAGDQGTLLHWNEPAWASVPSGTTRNLRAVWASVDDDVWAVGDGGTLIHWDGKAARPYGPDPLTSLRAVWGSDLNNVFAVGDGGSVLHFDGTAWSVVNPGTSSNLYGVWGSGSNDLWAVGIGGVVLHGDGKTWTNVESTTGTTLRAVSGSGPADVWIVGDGGTARHWDGKMLNKQDVAGSQVVDPDGVWVAPDGHAFVVGPGSFGLWAPGTPGSWGHIDSYYNSAVWGRSPMDVWAVGNSHDNVGHWTGSKLEDATELRFAFYGVWGNDKGVFAVGYGGEIVQGLDSKTRTRVEIPGPNLYAIWGTGSDFFAVGDGGAILRYSP